MPVMVMVWKSWITVSWNACGMCLICTPGMLSGPGALWLGRSRRASLKIAGVSLPMIMCCVGGGVAGIASSQGNAPLGSILESGESRVVSNFSTMAMTSAGLFVMSPVSGSRSAVMCCVLSVCGEEVWDDADLRIDLSVSLGFFTNIVKRADPLLAYLRQLACRITSLVATRCSLYHL